MKNPNQVTNRFCTTCQTMLIGNQQNVRSCPSCNQFYELRMVISGEEFWQKTSHPIPRNPN